MATYIALLRGVNVGQNLLKMERLRALAGELGFKNVSTYVQTGNMVFDADDSPAKCSAALEQKLAGETRLPVAVFVRTAEELKAIMARNPFLKDRTIDRTKLHVTFLAGAATKAGLAKLNAMARGSDEFRLGWQEVYVHCPNGYGRSKLSNNGLERALGVRASTRNWNTVNKLFEIASR